tara:strand:- start:57 stop:245 length:189 start_codon:yes stop_codon:yes gene_type:complete
VKEKELETLINLRQKLILTFSSLRDYKQNENAIMKEKIYAKKLHETIVVLDEVLKGYVNFGK